MTSYTIPSSETRLTRITTVLVFFFVMMALSVQLTVVYMHVVRPDRVNNFLHGTPEESINVGEVKNLVKIGMLAGNRNLAFGVKNILEEYVVEKDYTLNPYAEKRIDVEIMYLDVLNTSSNISVFHKNTEEVVIRLRGKLYKNNKLVKTVVVEESAEEVSMSAVLIDEGGKFNQQNLSAALKKSCNTLINKLL
jgi:hypothetical protein